MARQLEKIAPSFHLLTLFPDRPFFDPSLVQPKLIVGPADASHLQRKAKSREQEKKETELADSEELRRPVFESEEPPENNDSLQRRSSEGKPSLPTPNLEDHLNSSKGKGNP
ncbi:MAG: hypothetical protein AAF361_12800 [Bacteroidota bacterium]